ncbi:hypothetical protein Esi_0099_0088 [Ectocarpus siliculosus]|uniref:Uncharacterized protein n=1 Tax=Ectocarpus siliculosus TaxID=2880 RepID=D8LUC1_ECTSI|nr:hypothetical protein Esi_0099_0088 [Ectocarpus siliculosus]|eukprot:CBN75462.1 hypothetical protein Esi_0099_0088 [Ectocarpus siliculosus]
MASEEQSGLDADMQQQQQPQLEQPPPPPTDQPQQQQPPISVSGELRSHEPPAAGPPRNHANGEAAAATPDEVLALGVLALAGLWSGCWSGIATVIVHKVEKLIRSGSVDVPFRRCAQSLVDLLLQSPGESSLGEDTWRQLSSTQARLPHKLGQVLGIACSLLQRKAVEAADTRAKRKRRRCLSSSMAALKVPTPLPPPCTTGLVTMVGDIAREEEEQEIENMRKTQAAGAERSVNPPLVPPSQVFPPLLQQPLQPVPLPAQLQLSAGTAAPQPERTPPPSHGLYAGAPAAGGTEADFPVLLPHRATSAVPSSFPRPESLGSNGNHHGPPSLSPQEAPRPLAQEGSLAEQSVGAASLASNGNHHGPPSFSPQEVSRPLVQDGSLPEQSLGAASEACPSVP